MKNNFFNKKSSITITLIFTIILLFCFSTIAYSALSTTMIIDGIGYVRVDTDVRITEFRVDEVSNGAMSDNGRIKAYYDNGKVYIYSIDDIYMQIVIHILYLEVLQV